MSQLEGSLSVSVLAQVTPTANAGVGSSGQLSVYVWPVYVGLTVSHPGFTVQADGEPYYSAEYERGQIHWALEGDVVIGRATIHAPPGEYLYLVYFYGPGDMPKMCGYRLIDHPLVLTTTTALPVYPILEGDWVAQERQQRNGATIL